MAARKQLPADRFGHVTCMADSLLYNTMRVCFSFVFLLLLQKIVLACLDERINDESWAQVADWLQHPDRITEHEQTLAASTLSELLKLNDKDRNCHLAALLVSASEEDKLVHTADGTLLKLGFGGAVLK